MNDELDTMTDTGLNARFATEVAGISMSEHMSDLYQETGGNYCTDANEVLPWLEREGFWTNTFNNGNHIKPDERNWAMVFIGGVEYEAYAQTFPRAAVIALIRSRRAGKATA